MIQESDYTVLLETIEKMQKELLVLQREVVKLRNKRTGKQDRKKKPFKSLRGILPPTNMTMEDFREVRKSGTPRSLREP